MIPILFRADEINFRTNGIGRLFECVECTVTEERNGIYECEFKYPITGKWYQEMITNGGAVAVIHDDHKDIQAFDIYAHSAPIDGVVTFNAHHISYRLARTVVRPFQADSAALAMAALKTNSITTNLFTFWTDKATSGNFVLTHPDNVRALLGGQEGSILDVYGKGDYQFDMYTVRLYQNRGVNSGVTIRYGKNLVDIKHDKDESGAYTAIAPYWSDSDGNTVMLDDYIVVSPDAPLKMLPWTDESGNQITDENGEPIYFQYNVVTVVPYDFSSDFSEAPTKEELAQRALDFMAANETWLPSENLTVDFVQLWQTPEYESVAALQRVGLCDTVSVYYPELGVVSQNVKVIKVVYNVLLERFDSMEFGKPQTSLAQTITQPFEGVLNNAASKSFVAEAVGKATDMITGGLGGHVVMSLNADGQPQEILIMDTDDINTAVNVIRMNKNGIGFSQNGYNGPFLSAWTIDGAFNADFITTGTLLANFIHGGTLTLGGDGDGNGVMVVYDENNNVITTANNEGITSKSLVATDYVYVDGGRGSLVRIPSTNMRGFTEISGAHSFYVEANFTNYSQYFSVDENATLKTWRSDYANQYMQISEGGFVKYVNAPTRVSFHDGILEWITATPTSGNSYTEVSNAYISFTRSSFTNLSVSGTKSRTVKADEYGQRLLYCYETPTPMFGDIGEGQIDETGTCYVFLDPVFAETVSTASYQVFLQKYGEGECWISERKPAYFVVSGSVGLSFGWELKAKQKGYDQIRLERDLGDNKEKTIDYGDEAANYYYQIQEGRIA